MPPGVRDEFAPNEGTMNFYIFCSRVGSKGGVVPPPRHHYHHHYHFHRDPQKCVCVCNCKTVTLNKCNIILRRRKSKTNTIKLITENKILQKNRSNPFRSSKQFFRLNAFPLFSASFYLPKNAFSYIWKASQVLHSGS